MTMDGHFLSLSFQFRTAANAGLIERLVRNIGSISTILQNSSGDTVSAGQCTQTVIDVVFEREMMIRNIAISALEPALLANGPNGRFFAIFWAPSANDRHEFIANFDCRFLRKNLNFTFNANHTMYFYGSNTLRFIIKNHVQGQSNDYQLTMDIEEFT